MSKLSSITSQLIALSLVPASVVALAFALFYFATGRAELERSFVDEGQSVVGALARSAEFAISSKNPELIAAALKSITEKSNVRESAILRLDRSVVSAHKRAAHEIPSVGATRTFETPIRDAGTGGFGAIAQPAIVGTAQVVVDESPLLAARKKLLGIVALSVTAALAALVLVVAAWGKRVSRPLSRLHDVVARLSLGELGARAEPSGRGEIRALEIGVNNLARAIADNRRQLSEKVEAATEALKNQRDQAAAASQAKSRFLAVASHDLRQPMHALGLFCTALERRVQDGEQRKLLGNIQTSLRAMEGLFESLLDLSRLEAGRVVANVDRIPLQEVFEWIDLEYSSAARDKGLRFRVRRTDEWVQADITLLRRIVMNLVANAIRYTDTGGVIVGAQRRGDAVRVSVWDTGCGIDDASRSAIFDEFVQLKNDAQDKTKGLGLGLAIAKRSAQLMGTGIVVRSVQGAGSTFSIELVGARARATERASLRALATTVPHPWIGQRVLVIEDDESGRMAMVELLEQWGCIARGVESGDEAVNAVDERWTPTIILSDYRLRAGEVGPDAIARVEEKLHRSFPVVVVTGELGISVEPASLGNACWVVLRKPATAAALRTAMQEAVLAHKSAMAA